MTNTKNCGELLNFIGIVSGNAAVDLLMNNIIEENTDITSRMGHVRQSHRYIKNITRDTKQREQQQKVRSEMEFDCSLQHQKLLK